MVDEFEAVTNGCVAVYTFGSRCQYDPLLKKKKLWKGVGGTVFRDKPGQKYIVFVNGIKVEAGLYKVSLLNGWDKDVDEIRDGVGQLKTPSKIVGLVDTGG